MDTIERIARRNRLRAEEVIRDSRLAEIWRSVGAEVRQVGSLRSGLLMKHRDIDFHIYSSPLRLEESFAAMAQLAADPAVGRIECRNLLATDEACVEWHATYRDRDGDEWQLDMIHIVRGSRYDGYFERVADRIAAALTPVTRRAILQLKYDTPDEVKIAGIEYYVAVLRDGVRTYDAFAECGVHTRSRASSSGCPDRPIQSQTGAGRPRTGPHTVSCRPFCGRFDRETECKKIPQKKKKPILFGNSAFLTYFCSAFAESQRHASTESERWVSG